MGSKFRARALRLLLQQPQQPWSASRTCSRHSASPFEHPSVPITKNDYKWVISDVPWILSHHSWDGCFYSVFCHPFCMFLFHILLIYFEDPGERVCSFCFSATPCATATAGSLCWTSCKLKLPTSRRRKVPWMFHFPGEGTVGIYIYIYIWMRNRLGDPQELFSRITHWLWNTVQYIDSVPPRQLRFVWTCSGLGAFYLPPVRTMQKRSKEA